MDIHYNINFPIDVANNINNPVNNNNIPVNNNNNPNNNNNNQFILPVYHDIDRNWTIQELIVRLQQHINSNHMLYFLRTNIDYILYQTRPDDAICLNSYVDDLLNAVGHANTMVFANGDLLVIDMIMNIVNQCDRNQKKIIYNMISNL